MLHTVISAPSPVRDQLVHLTKRHLVNRCLTLEADTDRLVELVDDPDRLVVATINLALRDLARRWKALDAEVNALSQKISAPVHHAAPALVELFGVSAELAGQFLVTAGDNPERIRNEAAFAKLWACPQTGEQRPDQPTPSPQPQRRPQRQQRPVHHGHRPAPPPPAHPRLRRPAHRRRAHQTGNHPMPETLHRPRSLRCPPQTQTTGHDEHRLTT
jgi:hypothetical protein